MDSEWSLVLTASTHTLNLPVVDSLSSPGFSSSFLTSPTPSSGQRKRAFSSLSYPLTRCGKTLGIRLASGPSSHLIWWLQPPTPCPNSPKLQAPFPVVITVGDAKGPRSPLHLCLPSVQRSPLRTSVFSSVKWGVATRSRPQVAGQAHGRGPSWPTASRGTQQPGASGRGGPGPGPGPGAGAARGGLAAGPGGRRRCWGVTAPGGGGEMRLLALAAAVLLARAPAPGKHGGAGARGWGEGSPRRGGLSSGPGAWRGGPAASQAAPSPSAPGWARVPRVAVAEPAPRSAAAPSRLPAAAVRGPFPPPPGPRGYAGTRHSPRAFPGPGLRGLD